jgi:glycogen synthase
VPGAPQWQIVLLGTGDEHLERELLYLERHLPGRAKGIVHFEEQLAHRLVAAADILIVPSRFEPCGIVALAALRYGAVPVVASTGGLRDIVSGMFLLSSDDKGSSQQVLAPSPLLSRRPLCTRRSNHSRIAEWVECGVVG